MDYEIVRLRERPEWEGEAAAWFHEKWGIPLEAYKESMAQCLAGGGAVSYTHLTLPTKRT